VYSAQTTLWVIKDDTSQLSYNDVLLSRNLTKTYAEVAKSNAVLDEVIKSLALTGTTTGQLRDRLTVTPLRDTEILSFVVEDGNPARAAAIADAVATAFKGQISLYMKVENVAIVDRAIVPTSPIKPRSLMNVAVAVVLGGMAAVGLVFLLEYLDTSIKSPEDVNLHLELPVLGLIPTIEIPTEAGGAAPAIAASPVRTRRRKKKGVFGV
ncbi:MAG TPA: GNVR domain-containing protein, partial [Symbiobacteriaceae bacterium]|nr:GNVR domain-containing protein [Symbiobacteriaceae bacterium]